MELHNGERGRSRRRRCRRATWRGVILAATRATAAWPAGPPARSRRRAH